MSVKSKEMREKVCKRDYQAKFYTSEDRISFRAIQSLCIRSLIVRTSRALVTSIQMFLLLFGCVVNRFSIANPSMNKYPPTERLELQNAGEIVAD